MITPIYKIGLLGSNELYVKRDDLIPYSFGGNKARKAKLFFEEIDLKKKNCVITYGSSHSNHCRIVSNMCAERNISCYIISPMEINKNSFNSKFMKLFDSNIINTDLKNVKQTIDYNINKLTKQGFKPYFIPGGGHGNLGTQAYINCYKEILNYELEKNISFDYIFFASGTGTTQAGLICGKLMEQNNKNIIGISIARTEESGKKIIIDSVMDYFYSKEINFSKKLIEDNCIFIDDYISGGYSKKNYEIIYLIKDVMKKMGIPLDSVYTGKAFYGMKKFVSKKDINNKKILFIHTGGTPIFFDDMEGFCEYTNS